MPLTDENSLLILGAGTSAPHDLPLGGDLINLISDRISEELIRIQNKHGYIERHTDSFYELNRSASELDSFNKFPLLSSLARQSGSFSLGADFVEKIRELEDLRKRLLNQTSETIDDFIALNPSMSNVIKLCVSVEFFRKIYDFDSQLGRYFIRNFSSRESLKNEHFVNARGRPENFKRRNWTHLLINVIRHGVNQGQVSPENKIDIVSFNYDSILEYVLTEQFANYENGSAHWSEFINIVHPHGLMKQLPKQPTEPWSVIDSWADSIHVINEPNPSNEIENARVRARELVSNSREIYACGFAFSGPNIRMLGLRNISAPHHFRKIIAANYDGNLGLKHKLASLQRETPINQHIVHDDVLGKQVQIAGISVNEVSGSRSNPLPADVWFGIGAVGELPG